MPPKLFSPISFKSWEKLAAGQFPGSLVSSVIITVRDHGRHAGHRGARRATRSRGAKFRGRRFLGGWLLFSRMMPPVIFIIPLFLFFYQLG